MDNGLREHGDFNKYFDVCIIENSSPRLLEVKENKYTHILKPLRRLNTVNPFGLSILILIESLHFLNFAFPSYLFLS